MRNLSWTLLVLGLVLATDAEGQVQGPDGRIAFAATVGRMSSAPEQFTTAICPDPHPSSVDARLRIRLTRYLFAAGTLARYSSSPEPCVNGLVPPVPPQGPFVRPIRSYPAGMDEYPFGAYGVRLGGALSPEGLRASAGMSAGISWIPSKELVGPVLGFQTAIGLPRVPLSLTALVDWHRFRIPVLLGERQYFDGVLVESTARLESETTSFTVLRLGLEFVR
jgi:hypothetical protein